MDTATIEATTANNSQSQASWNTQGGVTKDGSTSSPQQKSAHVSFVDKDDAHIPPNLSVQLSLADGLSHSFNEKYEEEWPCTHQ
jgi:hypothetical protein